MRRWRARSRGVDLEILWPTIKAQAPDLNTAKMAMLAHCVTDEAWRLDYTVDEVIAMVDGLS